MREFSWRLHRFIRALDPSTRLVLASAALLLIAVAASVVFQPPPRVQTTVFAVGGLALATGILRRLRLPWSTTAIIVAALVLYGIYFDYTGFRERNFDGAAQLSYIRYIVEHRAVPPDDHCFVCHHPPGYYGLAAVVYDGCARTGLIAPVRGAQLLSLPLAFAFMVFAALIARRFTSKVWALSLTTAVIAFWPYGIVMSARLHNDALAIPVMTAASFFMVRWHQDDRWSDLVIAASLVIAGAFVKANALVLIGALGLLALYKFVLSADRRRFLRSVAPVLLVTVVASGVHFATRGHEGAEPDADTDTEVAMGERVLGSAYNIAERSYVGNEPLNYLYFDLQNFLQEPYVMARRDGSGREYLFNHLLKSSLFCTSNHSPDAETAYRFNMRIASFMNALLIGMILYAGSVLVRAKREHLGAYLPLVLASAAWLAGLVAFRFVVPHAHHCDFRHIYPILVPSAIALVGAVAWYRQQRSIMEFVGWVLCGGFVLLSIVYFLPKYDLIMAVARPHHIDVQGQALQHAVKDGAAWDARKHIRLERNDILRVAIDPTDAGGVELSVDHNDRYHVVVEFADGVVGFDIGPTPQKRKGMLKYTETFDPPLPGVSEVRIQALHGDHMYSVGSVVVRPPAPARP